MWSNNNTILYLRLGTPPIYHIRFLAYLLNLYMDTWSCLHVCPSLAYYDESYFAQQRLPEKMIFLHEIIEAVPAKKIIQHTGHVFISIMYCIHLRFDVFDKFSPLPFPKNSWQTKPFNQRPQVQQTKKVWHVLKKNGFTLMPFQLFLLFIYIPFIIWYFFGWVSITDTGW
jgi:hypothetical protein